FFNLAGIYIAATGDNHIIFSVSDIQKPISIKFSNVSAALPFTMPVCCRGLRIIKVAHHQMVTGIYNLAFGTRRKQVPLLIHDPETTKRQWHTSRPKPMKHIIFKGKPMLLLVQISNQLRCFPLAIALNKDIAPMLD